MKLTYGYRISVTFIGYLSNIFIDCKSQNHQKLVTIVF